MFILLVGTIYYLRCWDAYMRYDIVTKFHGDWYRRSSNASAVCKAVMFVLLMEVMYGVHHWDGLMWYNICTKIHEDWWFDVGIQAILRLLKGSNVGVTDGKDLWIARRWDGARCQLQRLLCLYKYIRHLCWEFPLSEVFSVYQIC
jgi:hypothetical protein